MDSKKPWQSKTMLINGLVGLAAFVALFVPGAQGVQPFIQAHAMEIGLVWSLLNMALRAISKDAISLGD